MEFVYNYPKYREEWKAINERNDCTVIAMAEVCQISYLEAHKIMKTRFGRKNRHGAYMSRYDFCKEMYEYTTVKGPYTRKNKISLNQFCKKHPKGRYYVLVSGHALAVIDGVVYDHSEKPRRMVYGAYRVYQEGELKK